MSNRNYNIFFHTHTVSGILISVVLFVIFFAGSFSFFRDDIANWERGESASLSKEIQLDYNKALGVLDSLYDLNGRKITISQSHNERDVAIFMEASKDSLASEKAKESQFLYIDNVTYKTSNYQESYNLGEFIYRLHFLAQIPYPAGYYLAGLIALFFLFATVTGVLLHWKKIVSNFYLFRPKEKLKIAWTDAHTSLGILGLPFQLVYAVTGAFFMIKVLIIAPTVQLLYQGNQEKFEQELEYTTAVLPFHYQKINHSVDINQKVGSVKQQWKGFDVTQVVIENYGDSSMRLTVDGALGFDKKFTAVGKAVYKVGTNELVVLKNPFAENSFLDAVKNILYRIHFGDYGGYGLKILSFILGILSCFVIISGVMIWLTARDKKNTPLKQKLFNVGVVRYYLAICLSMFPVTALSFLICKIWFPLGQEAIYWVYFISWLLLSAFLVFKNDNAFALIFCLIFGGVLGLFIPIANGFKTTNWFWLTFRSCQFQSFFIDVFWILLSIASLYVASIIIKRNKKRPS